MWIYSYLIFSLLLILFLILNFISLLEKVQSSKEGQKGSSFCCHNNGIKNQMKPNQNNTKKQKTQTNKQPNWQLTEYYYIKMKQ